MLEDIKCATKHKDHHEIYERHSGYSNIWNKNITFRNLYGITRDL